jgi:hypothetical protein
MRCSRRACRSLRSLWRPQLNAGTLARLLGGPVSKSEDQSADIATTAVGSAASAVTQAAATALSLSPELGVALSIFAGTIPALIRNGFARRAERRCALAAHGMEVAATQQNATVEEVSSAGANPDVFLSMFYDLIDSVDEAAAQPLGHLAMTYAHLGLAPDRFFRAFGRVVRELDSTELLDLTKLLDVCTKRIDSHEAPFADSDLVRTNFRDPIGHSLEARGRDDEWHALLEVSSGVRLLLLMKQHGLAAEPTDVPGVVGGDPVRARIWRGFGGRALTHLRLEKPQPLDVNTG